MTPRKADLDLELAREILGYFFRNPRAVDTAQGIARWRLLDEAIRRNLQQVTGAIAWLVREGLLVQVPTTSSESLFHLNEQQMEETKKFLNRETLEAGPKRPEKDES